MNLIQMSIAGAAIILAVAALRTFCAQKLPKRLFVMLWEIVLLRLVIPLSVPLPILPVETSYPEIQYVQPAQTEYIPQVPQNVVTLEPHADFVAPWQNEIKPTPVPPAVTQKETVAEKITPEEPKKPAFTLPKITPEGIWAAIAICIFLYFATAYIKGIRRFKYAETADLEYVCDWLYIRGLRKRVRVKISQQISSPLTYGIFRPVILLPPDIETVDEHQLGYILEHEYAHIRHCDSLKKLFAAVVLCIHWFNPLVWVLFILYNNDMELWCDESVLKRFGEKSRAPYARALISMEEMKCSSPLMSCLRKNPVEKRIISIMTFKKTGFLSAFTAVLAATCITLSVFATSIDPVPKEIVPPDGVPDNIVMFGDMPVSDAENAGSRGSLSLNTAAAKSSLLQVANVVGGNQGENGSVVFEEGGVGAVIFDLGRVPDESEAVNLNSAAIFSGSQGDKIYKLGTQFIHGTKVIFPFVAPKSGEYIFCYGNSGDHDISFSSVYAFANAVPSDNGNYYSSSGDMLDATEVAGAIVIPAVNTDGDNRKTIYDGENIITDTVNGDIDNSYHFLYLNAGERVAICLDHADMTAEDNAALNVTARRFTEYDTPDGNAYMFNDEVYIIRSKVYYDSDSNIAYTFKAPEDSLYLFSLNNYSGEWFYADSVHIEIEKDSENQITEFESLSLPDDPQFYIYESMSAEDFNSYENAMYFSYGIDKHKVNTPENIIYDEVGDSDINYIQVGEPFSDYYEYDSVDERYSISSGTKGLYYTVNTWTIYDSFEKGGFSNDMFYTTPSIQYFNMKFLVIDMTAEYHRPVGSDASEVTPTFMWNATFRHGVQYKYYDPDIWRYYVGMAQALFQEDHGDGWISHTDTSMKFLKPISDGETLHFRVGFFISDYNSRKGNFYLCRTPHKACEDQPKIPYIDVFGRMK